MSLFSSIRKSRQQAREHNAKIAEQKKKEDEDKTPYRHVPTHAATDAFASAPPAWRETSDLPKIAEQNRRRSAMSANGQPLNIPGPNMARVGSSLSFVSYPGQSSQSSQSSFRSRMPRAYSYNGGSPYPGGSRDIIYSIPDVAYSEPEGLGNATSESNNGSNSSQDNLEMKSSSKAPATGQSPVTTGKKDSHTHPNVHSRRMSDGGSEISGTGVRKSGTSSTSRDSRPPPSTRGFNAIRPQATYAPLQVGKAPGPMPVEAISSMANGASNGTSSSSRQNSFTSLPDPVATSSKQVSPSAEASPAPSLPPSSDFNLNSVDITSNTDTKPSSESDTKPSRPQSQRTAERPAPKTTRFTELDTSSTEASVLPPPAPPVQVVNFFPEPAAPEPPRSSKSKGKIFSKGGGSRLLKKDRRASIWAS